EPAAEALAARGREPFAEERAKVRRRGEQRHRRIEIGDVDELASAASFAGEEREHDAERTVKARAAVVRDEVERDRRFAIRLTDHREHTGERQIVEIVGGTVAIGAVLSEPGERAINEARIFGAQRLIVSAEPLHDAGAKTFDQHVGPPRQFLKYLLALC